MGDDGEADGGCSPNAGANMSRPSSRLNPLIRRTPAVTTSSRPIQPGR